MISNVFHFLCSKTVVLICLEVQLKGKTKRKNIHIIFLVMVLLMMSDVRSKSARPSCSSPFVSLSPPPQNIPSLRPRTLPPPPPPPFPPPLPSPPPPPTHTARPSPLCWTGLAFRPRTRQRMEFSNLSLAEFTPELLDTHIRTRSMDAC